MDRFLHAGRYIFATGMVAFGGFHLFAGRFHAGLPPVPGWVIASPVLVYAVGAALIAAGVSIATGKAARLSATLMAFLFLFCTVFLHAHRLRYMLSTGNGRTRGFEALAFAGAWFVLAGTFPLEWPDSPVWNAVTEKFILAGRFLFGIPLLIFGWQHFIAADFIASLIPAWVPFRLFWAYFFGCTFIAAGIAIMTKIAGRLAAALLGVQYMLWVVVLHIPSSVSARTNIDKWESMVVAFTLSGAAFVIATTMPQLHTSAAKKLQSPA